MLFKYTFKNTEHWELNHQAVLNYKTSETANYIYRIYFIWRNFRPLYNLIRKHTLRNQHAYNWNNCCLRGPSGQLFRKRQAGHTQKGHGGLSLTEAHTSSWFNALELCITKHGLEMRMSRKFFGISHLGMMMSLIE